MIPTSSHNNEARTPLALVGNGGHAKVVAAVAHEAGFSIAAIIDEARGDSLKQLVERGITYVHVAIGSNKARQRLYREACALGLVPTSVISPTALIAPDAVVGVGVFIAENVIIHPTSVVANYALLNTACIIEHDCSVAEAAFIAPGAILCGACGVGERTFVGTHATLIPGVTLGSDVNVGAGATITHDFRDGLTLVGTPAIPAATHDETAEHHDSGTRGDGCL